MTRTPEYKEAVGSCKACGNSPVNHHLAWVLRSADVVLSVANRYFSRYRAFIGVHELSRLATSRIALVHYLISSTMRITAYNADHAKAATYRSQVIWEEATRRGIAMEQVCVYGKPIDTYRARIHGSWFYFDSLPIPPGLEQRGYLWLDDKYLLARILKEQSLASPGSFSVTTLAEARRAFAVLGTVIVKPRVGSRGRHTTTFVSSEAELEKAFLSAKQLCYWVIIQKHLRGSVCRATVVNGSLAGFFQADPPRVVGDGVSTIRQRVDAKNAARHERVQPVELTYEHEAFLNRQGYDLDTVLPANVSVDLSHRTGRLFGGETREILTTVHPVIRTEVERAARTLLVPVVGFDLISLDPVGTPKDGEWGIIEANSLPFIDLHYLPLYGTPSNVAAAVWDLWNIKGMSH